MNKRKIRIKYLLIFATLLFCSCQKKEGYTADLLNCDEIQYLKSEIINDSFVFASPKAILSNDSLLIVVDTRLNDSIFHLFRKSDGRFIQSGGCKGEGLGELLMPGTPFISQTGVLSFWDMYKSKVVGYDLKEIIADRQETGFSEYPIKKEDAFTSYLEVVPLSSGRYLYNGNNNKHLGIMGSDSYVSCPVLPEITLQEELWSVMNYSKMALSPDQKHFVQATYIGGVVRGFEISGNKVKEKFLNLYFAPRYELVDGAKPAWIKWCDESRMGFESVCATNDYIYLLLNGKCARERPFANEILVMDWNGNIIKRMKLDRTVKAITVDEAANTIYAISAGFNTDPSLLLFKM